MKSIDTKNQTDKLIQSEPDTNQSKSEAGTFVSNNSKRRLLRTIVTTAPVVMAVSSKPALANNLCAISGFLSGNLSNPNHTSSCGGKSPGSRKNHTYGLEDTKFGDVFGGLWHNGGGTTWPDTVTFDTVLNTFIGVDDEIRFGFHAVAAYLNSLDIPGYMGTADVVDMVSQIVNTGVYIHPGTGIILNAEQVKAFIEQTYN